MNQILDSFDTATQVTARRLTAGIRRTATKSGWDNEVASSLSVKYADGKFDVEIPDTYKEAAMTFEYGDTVRRPTSVIRKYKFSSLPDKTFLSTMSEVGYKK